MTSGGCHQSRHPQTAVERVHVRRDGGRREPLPPAASTQSCWCFGGLPTRLMAGVLLLASEATGYDLVVSKAAQLVCTGGASYTELGPRNTKGMPGLRSGDPGGPSMCRLKDPVPVPINSIQLTFQYVVGYTPPKGTQKEGPSVAIWAEDVHGSVATDTGSGPVYQSPELPVGDDQLYSFDTCEQKDKQLCYSPNVAVNADCAACSGRYIAFKFENKERNLQIMLPITLHIDELDWGTPFVLALLGCLTFYAGGGIMYGRHRNGATTSHKGTDAWKAHPHAQRLEEFAGLVMDGWTFSRMRLGGKSGYKPVDREVRHPSKAKIEDVESGSKRDKRRSSHMSTSSSSKSPKTSSSAGKHQKRKSAKKDTAERSSDVSGKGDSPREKSAASVEVPDDAKRNEGAAGGFGGALQEERDEHNVHSSQAKIKVVGLNS